MMKKKVYGIDDDSFPLQGCIVRKSTAPLETSGVVAVSTSSSGQQYSLSLQQEDWVGSDDMILSQCMVEWLGLSQGQECSFQLSTAPLFKPTNTCRISLQFIAFKTLKHWDLRQDLDSISSSMTWTRTWPKGVPIESVMKSLPLCMQGHTIRSDTMIPVQVLDSWMIFKIVDCESGGDRVECPLEVNDYCGFHLVESQDRATTTTETTNHDNREFSLEITQRNLDFDFIRPFVAQLTNCLRRSAEFQQVSLFTRSFLIDAPSGSGKSYILNNLQESLVSSLILRSQPDSLLIAKGCCSKLSTKNWQVIEKQGTSHNDFINNCLLNVLSALDSKFSDYTIEKVKSTITNGQLLILIDDLDMLFRLYIDPDDWTQQQMILPLNDEVSILKNFGYYLQYLLKELAGDTQNLRLWIVGTSSVPPTKLPRSAVGAPEFERVVVLPKPSYDDRIKIASKVFSNIANSKNIMLSEDCTVENSTSKQPDILLKWSTNLAAMTRGYLPADIQAVINRALLMASGSALSSSTGCETTHLSWRKILDAAASVPLKTLQSIDYLSLSQEYDRNCTWNDFAGYKETISNVQRLLRPFSQSNNINSSTLARFKLPRGMVLHGPSGCGKTLLAKIIAKQLQMNFLRVQSSDLLSKYFGQTEEKIRKLFQVARSTSPSVLFFDDFDALAHKRSNSTDGSHGSLHNRVLSTFLNELDGISVASTYCNSTHEKKASAESAVFVLAACKDLALLDEALIRPGRLQYHVLLDYPSERDTKELFESFSRSIPIEASVDIEDIITLITSNTVVKPTAATIEAFCNQVRLVALRDEIKKRENESLINREMEQLPAVAVTQRHFDEVVTKMFVREEDLIKARLDIDNDDSIFSK